MSTIEDAVPAEHFARPPYHVEVMGKDGWAGVMNRDGFNCLTFKSRPGQTLTDEQTACAICERWNSN